MVQHIRWECPEVVWIKLTVDGEPIIAGAEGVIRDSTFKWIKSFERFLGQVDSLISKAWALRDGFA